MSKVSSIIGWICVGLVAAFTLFSAVTGLLPKVDPNVLLIQKLLGIDGIVRELSILQIFIVILYIIPRTSTIGFIFMICLYGGALATQITHGFEIAPTIMFPLDTFGFFLCIFALLTLGVYCRNPELLWRFKGKGPTT